MPSDLRTRKRTAMRDHISDVASRLFAERGFDNVTVDEIALKADVGRKTVFNHFPRKEDLFFDRDDEIRRLVGEAIQSSGSAGPVESLRLLVHNLVNARSPYVESSPAAVTFMQTIAASETLSHRARALRDELAEFIARALAARVGHDVSEPDSLLAANLIVAIWVTSRVLAHRAFMLHGDAAKARATFLSGIDKGHRGLQAAMVGTPYAVHTSRTDLSS